MKGSIPGFSRQVTTSSAISMSWFVTPDIAEITTPSSCPSSWYGSRMSTTRCMRSPSPTEVPPNFMRSLIDPLEIPDSFFIYMRSMY